MKFADKMKDVELNPYMLAIYKDNEHHHLLHHAMKAWEKHRHTAVGNFRHNPITYAPYPPMELIEKYNISPVLILGSRVIRCPNIIKWAALKVINSHELELWQLQSTNFWIYVMPHMVWDDELVYAFAQAGLGSALLNENVKLTDEQRATAIICA